MRTRCSIAALCLLVAACSAEASVGDAATAGSPATAVSDSVPAPEEMTADPLVAFEAGWLCQVQRRSFSDLDEMQELRADLLDEAGVTSSEYEEFRTALDSDPDRRSEVLMVFEGSCK